MNIVLLVIDTFRYDHLAALGGNQMVATPNLDRFASESWSFDRAFASSYPTIPFRTDVITGSYGEPFNPWAPLPFDVESLPRALAEGGYATQLIHDTPHLVNGGHAFDYHFHGWSFIRGAEVDRPWIDGSGYEPLANWATDPMFDFIDPEELIDSHDHVVVTYSRANRGRSRREEWNAAQLADTVARFFSENRNRENFFLWVDCFDPHEPWDVPPDYLLKYDKRPGFDGKIDPRVFLPAARRAAAEGREDVAERLRNLYSAKVTWMDHQVGVMLDALAESGLADKTAVVISGDHGTNLGERGQFGKGYPVYEQEGHIPLLLHAPGIGSGRSDEIVQPQDIHATILELGGCDASRSDGTSLLRVSGGGSTGRSRALSGHGTIHWRDEPDRQLFTIFDGDFYLTVAADPEACSLFRRGTSEEISSSRSDKVEELRSAAFELLLARGAGSGLVEWLRSGGRASFPAELPGRRPPPGYRPYWQNNYTRW